MAYKIFISSASSDIDLARDLAQRLKDIGVEVYSEVNQALSNKATKKATKTALDNADEVFVMLTTESIDNLNLMYFLGAASSMGKHVSPVVVGIETAKIPPLIKSLEYIRYPDLGRYIANLEKRTKAA